ncbi:MAG: ATP-binding protein [Verrucomicrobiota bacterium]
MSRVVFIGAECTGKSSLTAEIAARFDEPFSREYVRDYAERLDREIREEDLEPIARGQLSHEDEALKKASVFVFHDTNILSSILYARHYFGKRYAWVDRFFEERVYDHYFICQPDIPWVEDPGQRVSSEERDELHLRFKQILEDYGIPAVPVEGTLAERIKTVEEALK